MDNLSRRSFLTVVGGATLLFGLGACSTTELSDQEAQKTRLAQLRAEKKYKEFTVEIGDNFFAPQIAEVEPGTIVIWDHVGRSIHDIVWDDRQSKDTTAEQDFTSEVLRGGDIHVWLFEEPGTYNYHCRYHGGPKRGHWGAIKVSSTDRNPSQQD